VVVHRVASVKGTHTGSALPIAARIQPTELGFAGPALREVPRVLPPSSPRERRGSSQGSGTCDGPPAWFLRQSGRVLTAPWHAAIGEGTADSEPGPKADWGAAR